MEAAQIWRELVPHYFPADCFGGSYQNHLNCHDECIYCIDIIACGFSIQPSYSEFILPNLHLLTLIAFLQLFSSGFFWRQLRFGKNWLHINSGGLFWRELKFGGNWLHIFFRQIVLEAAQIWKELAPHYFPTDYFGGSSNLEGTGSTLFSGRLFWKFGGSWLHIIFWWIVSEAAQIWRELAPHYFPTDCFGGSSNLEGIGSTLFSDIVLEAAQIWRELAPH